MSLSINDGKGTPVAHVFTQDAQQQGVTPALLVNRASSNGPSFWERITHAVTLGKTNKQKNVVKTKFSFPKAGTVDGNPAVMGTNEYILTALLDDATSTVPHITDDIALIKNYLSNAAVVGQIVSLAPVDL